MMKRLKLFLPATLLCGLSLTAHAAARGEQKVYLGGKIGGNMSRVFFTPSIKQTFVPGINAGLSFRYIEEDYFGLIGELNFTQRGWKEDFENYPYEYQRNLNYLEIPLLSHIYFGKDNKFFINLGPELSVLLGESTKANFDYRNIDNIPDFPKKLRTTYQYQMAADNKIDYGITAGMGGEFSIGGTSSLSIEMRAYYGLGNVLKSGREELFKGSNSLSIMLSTGYWFRAK